MRTSAFAQQTTVQQHPGGEGHYRAVVSDQWNAPVLPPGGVVTALALRAMAAEVTLPDESLRSVTTVFAAQVPPGPVDIDVTVLRRGRTMSQATATVRPVGATAGTRPWRYSVGRASDSSSPTCAVPMCPRPSSARRFVIRSPRV